jgi:hypothetical protein
MKRPIMLILTIAFAVYIGIAYASVPPQKCCKYFNGCQHNCDRSPYTLSDQTTKTGYIWTTAKKGPIHCCINDNNKGTPPAAGGNCWDNQKHLRICADVDAYDKLTECQQKENRAGSGETTHPNCKTVGDGDVSTECTDSDEKTTQPFVFPAASS